MPKLHFNSFNELGLLKSEFKKAEKKKSSFEEDTNKEEAFEKEPVYASPIKFTHEGLHTTFTPSGYSSETNIVTYSNKNVSVDIPYSSNEDEMVISLRHALTEYLVNHTKENALSSEEEKSEHELTPKEIALNILNAKTPQQKALGILNRKKDISPTSTPDEDREEKIISVRKTINPEELQTSEPSPKESLEESEIIEEKENNNIALEEEIITPTETISTPERILVLETEIRELDKTQERIKFLLEKYGVKPAIEIKEEIQEIEPTELHTENREEVKEKHIPIDEIRELVTENLQKILELKEVKEKKLEIKALEITPEGDSIKIKSKIFVGDTGEWMMRTLNVEFIGYILNENKSIKIGNTYVDAGLLATNKIEKMMLPELHKIAPIIKKHLEVKEGKEIETIRIQKGELVLQFK